MENENCHVDPLEKPLEKEDLATAMAAYLHVSGMGCPSCAMRVRNGLLTLEGVLLADVFLERGVAAAAYDPQRVEPSDLVQAVAGSGNDGRHHYQAEVVSVVPATEALAPWGEM
ncbi:MAG: heavy-metal-associated domain-containing protein [Chloroflexi bacterium]|nr:heavy-metal-associated domain-containing protein [Chloroflexota bacterium]